MFHMHQNHPKDVLNNHPLFPFNKISNFVDCNRTKNMNNFKVTVIALHQSWKIHSPVKSQGQLTYQMEVGGQSLHTDGKSGNEFLTSFNLL